jgi:pimeloyl-ACP methyl ester carboxylesterase
VLALGVGALAPAAEARAASDRAATDIKAMREPADPGVASIDFAPTDAGPPGMDSWRAVHPEGLVRDPITRVNGGEIVGINDNGELFGRTQISGGSPDVSRATRWNADGTIADVWGPGTAAAALNEQGTMVGTEQIGGRPHAVVWKDGQRIVLPDDGASTSAATDVSNNDVVTGSITHGQLTMPVVWYLAGEHIELHEAPLPPGTHWGVATRINDANVVLLSTDFSVDATGVTVPGAWLWWVGDEAGAQPIPGATAAVDLNETNYALVDLFTGSAAAPRSGTFHLGAAQPHPIYGIDNLTSSVASGLNSYNDVVGSMLECTFCGNATPVMWEEEFGGMPVPLRLRSLLAEVPGYEDPNKHHLTTALDINDDRAIVVGTGQSWDLTTRDYLVMIPEASPARLDDTQLEAVDYPSNEWEPMPARGVVQDTPSRVSFTVSNPDPRSAHIVSVELLDAETGERVPDGYWFEALDPDEQVEGSLEFDTAGLDFDDNGESRPPLEIEIVLKGDGKEIDRYEASVPISPDPVVLVHGFNSDAAAWSAYDGFLRSVHPGWLSFAVGDGQAHGVMDTGSLTAPDTPANTIAENAAILAEYIEGVRDRSNARHVDIVAHSMGGLISREYIHDWMPMADDSKPLVSQLVMLGTPNAGSPCAQIMNLAGMRELREDVLADFNQRITNRKGVEMSILTGSIVPFTCQSSENGDGVVPESSTMASTWDDSALMNVLHTSMTNRAMFDFFVWPELVGGGPRGSVRDASGGPRVESYEPESARSSASAGPLPPLALSRSVTVPAEESVEIPFDADGASRLGVAAVAVEGVSAELVDPQGAVVQSGEGGQPMLTLSSGESPAAGTWRLRISNRNIDEATVGLAVYLNNATTTLAGTIDLDEYGVARMTASFVRGIAPLPGATVSARFVSLSGDARNLVLTEQSDGTYRGASQTLPQGEYRVALTAGVGTMERATLLDLTVGPSRGDSTKPTVRVEYPEPDGAGWYRDRVAGVIRASDDASGVSTLSYDLTGASDASGETTESELAFEIVAEGETQLWWFVRDHAGNFRRPDAGVEFRVDATAPSVTIEGVDGAVVEPGEELTARFSCADAHSGVATCAGSTADGAALPTQTPGTHELEVRALDAVGHETVQTATYTVSGEVPDDTVPPTVTAKQPETGPSGWHGGPVTVELAATDALSGVASVSWRVDDGPVTTVTGDRADVAIDAPGDTRVTYWATDAAGNEADAAVALVRIDVDRPFVNVSSPAEGAAYALDEQVTLDYSVTDEESGMQSTTATVTTPQERLAPVVLERGDALPTSATGDHLLTVTATDAAGNTTTVERVYSVLAAAPDTTAPSIDASVPAPGGWSAGPAAVLLSASDASGVAAVHWRLVGASTGSGSAAGPTAEIPVAAEGTTTVEYWAVDAVGNQSAVGRATVRVDATAPGVRVDAPVDGAVYRAAEVGVARFACEDTLSGITLCSASTPAGQQLPASAGGHAFVVEAVDAAGNRTSVTVRYTVVREPVGGSGNVPPGTLPPSGVRGGDVPPRADALAATGAQPIEAGLLAAGLMLAAAGLVLVRRRGARRAR